MRYKFNRKQSSVELSLLDQEVAEKVHQSKYILKGRE